MLLAARAAPSPASAFVAAADSLGPASEDSQSSTVDASRDSDTAWLATDGLLCAARQVVSAAQHNQTGDFEVSYIRQSETCISFYANSYPLVTA